MLEIIEALSVILEDDFCCVMFASDCTLDFLLRRDSPLLSLGLNNLRGSLASASLSFFLVSSFLDFILSSYFYTLGLETMFFISELIILCVEMFFDLPILFLELDRLFLLFLVWLIFGFTCLEASFFLNKVYYVLAKK